MFHTFETSNPSRQEASSAEARSKKRKASTVRACEPCRQRKIRCTGKEPCDACQWYRKPELCRYTEPRPRASYQRTVEKMASVIDDYQSILRKLYPSVPLESLRNLPREKLIETISQGSTHHLSLSPALSHTIESEPTAPNPEAGSLEALQTMPEESSDTTENRSYGISDDINALSLSVKQSSSYLGISSVMAALRVILYLDPESQSYFTKTSSQSAPRSREMSATPETPDKEHDPLRSIWDEIPIINAYFTYVHALVPILEEQSFRDTYTSGERHDNRWLALLNVVLAMGAVAASSSEDLGHRMYFNRAKQYLGLESLGSAHLETVQTLALLGGYYLHYIQQPNLAITIMGATLRLALALGLHREYLDGRNQQKSQTRAFSVEMRRRVWWCVFSLDSWANLNLGRPSMGRWSQGITVKPPQLVDVHEASPVLLLQQNIAFCLMTTKIEDALAISPLIAADQLAALDDALTDWHRNLPASLQNSQVTPRQYSYEMPGLTVAKSVFHWRYHLARISLHRPVLLWYALSRKSFSSISSAKQQAIQKCREAAADAIEDISSNWKGTKPCQMSGWNATWMIYQASLVPLLSLFSDVADATIVERSQQQVETVLSTLIEIDKWSATGTRSLEVVSKIYEASKRYFEKFSQRLVDQGVGTSNFSTPAIPQNMRFPVNQQDWTVPNSDTMDTMWDSLNWSTGWEDMGYPFEAVISPDWEYGPTSSWNEQFQSSDFFSGAEIQQNTGFGYSGSGVP